MLWDKRQWSQFEHSNLTSLTCIILGELSKISEIYNTASFEYIFKVDVHKAPYILQEILQAKPDSVGSL